MDLMEFIDIFLDYWPVWVVPTAVAAIWHFIAKNIAQAPGVALENKFASLGNLKGRKLSEIKSVCGSPSSVSQGANGVRVYQWMAGGYHIVLLFDKNDICLGVNSESSVSL